ncbi:MAG: riboflavin synthase [Alphaproteobacteria bacterium]|nr:riboflavin synthase [Alphaproteobacteria bacterium]
MFTGLIQDVGQVVSVAKTATDVMLSIRTEKLPLDAMPMGASIACNGVCLTLIEKKSGEFKVQVSAESLAKTTIAQWNVGTAINLEPSLKLGDELGGHLVYGHVDGVGTCVSVTAEGDCWRFVFEVPHDLAPFIAAKGSITIDGISLTVNSVDANRFGVMIIPHTFMHTSIQHVRAGSVVNIEIDMLARYVARLQNYKVS